MIKIEYITERHLTYCGLGFLSKYRYKSKTSSWAEDVILYSADINELNQSINDGSLSLWFTSKRKRLKIKGKTIVEMRGKLIEIYEKHSSLYFKIDCGEEIIDGIYDKFQVTTTESKAIKYEEDIFSITNKFGQEIKVGDVIIVARNRDELEFFKVVRFYGSGFVDVTNLLSAKQSRIIFPHNCIKIEKDFDVEEFLTLQILKS